MKHFCKSCGDWSWKDGDSKVVNIEGVQVTFRACLTKEIARCIAVSIPERKAIIEAKKRTRFLTHAKFGCIFYKRT
ncbi:hypothetical protein LCGC14_0384340 [marine sediment metagenome]|uniref:Uncharacterized protein n=1 Tax=marine sediment metagenome TaxID=412755 RepID=A0A0F9T1A5_9ZZZZ